MLTVRCERAEELLVCGVHSGFARHCRGYSGSTNEICRHWVILGAPVKFVDTGSCTWGGWRDGRFIKIGVSLLFNHNITLGHKRRLDCVNFCLIWSKKLHELYNTRSTVHNVWFLGVIIHIFCFKWLRLKKISTCLRLFIFVKIYKSSVRSQCLPQRP